MASSAIVRGPCSAAMSSQSSRRRVTCTASPGSDALRRHPRVGGRHERAHLVDLAHAAADLVDDGVDVERPVRADPVDGVGLELEGAVALAEETDQGVVDDREEDRGEQVAVDGALVDQQLAHPGLVTGGLDGGGPLLGAEPARADQRAREGVVGVLVAGEVELPAVQVHRAAGLAAEADGAGLAGGRQDAERARR